MYDVSVNIYIVWDDVFIYMSVMVTKMALRMDVQHGCMFGSTDLDEKRARVARFGGLRKSRSTHDSYM